MKIVTIALIIFFASFLYAEAKRKGYAKQVQNQLVELLNHKEFSSFEKHLKDAEENGYIQEYNANYLRMNASILQDDRKALNHVLLRFDAMELSDVQSSAVYSNIMMFAVEKKDMELCKRAYSNIMSLKKNEQLKDMATLVYKVFVTKDCSVKDEIQQRLHNTSNDEQIFLEKLQKLI